MLFRGLIARAPSPAALKAVRPMDGRQHELVSERTDYGLRGKERGSGGKLEECRDYAQGVIRDLQEQLADEGQSRPGGDTKRGT